MSDLDNSAINSTLSFVSSRDYPYDSPENHLHIFFDKLPGEPEEYSASVRPVDTGSMWPSDPPEHASVSELGHSAIRFTMPPRNVSTVTVELARQGFSDPVYEVGVPIPRYGPYPFDLSNPDTIPINGHLIPFQGRFAAVLDRLKLTPASLFEIPDLWMDSHPFSPSNIEAWATTHGLDVQVVQKVSESLKTLRIAATAAENKLVHLDTVNDETLNAISDVLDQIDAILKVEGKKPPPISIADLILDIASVVAGIALPFAGAMVSRALDHIDKYKSLAQTPDVAAAIGYNLLGACRGLAGSAAAGSGPASDSYDDAFLYLGNLVTSARRRSQADARERTNYVGKSLAAVTALSEVPISVGAARALQEVVVTNYASMFWSRLLPQVWEIRSNKGYVAPPQGYSPVIGSYVKPFRVGSHLQGGGSFQLQFWDKRSNGPVSEVAAHRFWTFPYFNQMFLSDDSDGPTDDSRYLLVASQREWTHDYGLVISNPGRFNVYSDGFEKAYRDERRELLPIGISVFGERVTLTDDLTEISDLDGRPRRVPTYVVDADPIGSSQMGVWVSRVSEWAKQSDGVKSTNDSGWGQTGDIHVRMYSNASTSNDYTDKKASGWNISAAVDGFSADVGSTSYLAVAFYQNGGTSGPQTEKLRSLAAYAYIRVHSTADSAGE